MEEVHEFKHLRSIMNVMGTGKVECKNQVMGGKRVVGQIRALVKREE